MPNMFCSGVRRFKPCIADLFNLGLKSPMRILGRDLMTSDERRSVMVVSHLEARYRFVDYNAGSRLNESYQNKEKPNRPKVGVEGIGFENPKCSAWSSHIEPGFDVKIDAFLLVPNPIGSLGPREIRSDGALTSVRTRAVCLVKRDEQEVMA